MFSSQPARCILCSLVAVVLLLPGAAGAGGLFRSAISIDGGPISVQGTNKARRIPDLFSTRRLLDIDPGYTPTDAVLAELDVRGLRALLGFGAGSTALRLLIPGAVDVTFDGGSREASRKQLEAWLEGDFSSATAPGDQTTKFLQALVEHSPVDPVAGNPNSLQSRMFAADWRMGTSGESNTWVEGWPLTTHFRADLGAGYYDADGFDVATIDVPLHLSLDFQRVALLVDVPITATSTEGAWSGMGSGGLGVRVSPFQWWSLTPVARIGGVGSVDLGGVAAMYSASLTSQVRIPLGLFAVGVGNMAGVAQTIDSIDLGGYGLAYELTNWTFRNGGYVEGFTSFDFLGAGIGWRVYGSDVRFIGDDLYMDSYAEVGAGLGADAILMGLGLDISYLFGRNYGGLSARLSARF